MTEPDVTEPELPAPATAWEADDEEPEATPVDLSGEQVTAVLVCHDSTTWLPSALASLAALDPAPDYLVAVNNTPGDEADELLEAARHDGTLDLVLPGRREHGFAEAVAAGLSAADADLLEQTVVPRRGTGAPARRWVWLLHDDVVADPDVLGELLRHVVTDEGVDLTGPTLLVPSRANQPRRLTDSAVGVAGSGRPVPAAEPGEVLQGQLDRPTDVLGLSTCGLLVRRDVWDALGGLAPELPVFRDGVELGWRATRAGFRVATTPTAQLVHRRVGRAGLRARSHTGSHPAAVDRALGMRLVAAHRTGPAALLTSLRLVLGCLLRVLGFVLGKAPDRAADEWRALRRHLTGGRPRARLRERVGAAPVTEQGRAAARRLRPRWWYSLRLGVEWVAGAVSDGWRELGGRRQDTSLDELTGDDFAGREEAGAPWWHAPLALLVGVVLVAGVFGRVLSPGLLTSTQLLPGAGTLSASWSRYLDPVAAADGVTAPPWVGLAALLSTPLAGHTDWVLVLVLAGAVGLAFLTARTALRALDVDPVTAVWLAALWALLPTVLGAAQRGSLLAVGFAVVLPLLLRAATRLVGRPGLESLRGAFGVALAGTVLLALQPALLVLLVPAGLLGVLLRPGLRAQSAVAVGVPVLLLAPWWPTLLRHPGRLLTGPSPTLVPDEPATPWRLLLGQTPGPAWFDGGPVPLWLTAPVVLGVLALALVGLVRRGRQPVVRTTWLVAVLALAAAVLSSRLVVTVPPYGEAVRPELSGWLLLALGALLVAGARGLPASRLPSVLRRAVSVLVVLVLLAVGTAWWVFDGVTGPAERRTSALPPFITSAMADQPVRTLAVDLTGDRTRWNLLAADGPRLGDAERGLAVTAGERDELGALVTRLVSTGGDDEATRRLAELGVGFVWVRGAEPVEVTTISSTPGLQVGSDSPTGRVWTLPAGASAAPDALVDPVRRGLAVAQLVLLLGVVVMAAPALRREDEDEPVARRGRAVLEQEAGR